MILKMLFLILSIFSFKTYSEVINVTTKSELDQHVGKGKVCVVDFHAEKWCGPCKAYATGFKTLAAENTDAKFIKVNTDEAEDLTRKFNIGSLPTTIVFEPGSKTPMEEIKGVNVEGVKKAIEKAKKSSAKPSVEKVTKEPMHKEEKVTVQKVTEERPMQRVTVEKGIVAVKTQDELDQHIKNGSPVVVKYYMPGCGPCEQTKPVFEELSDKYGNKIKFVIVDSGQVSLVKQAGITGFPTFKFYQNGNEVGRFSGGRIDKLREEVARLAGEPIKTMRSEGDVEEVKEPAKKMTKTQKMRTPKTKKVYTRKARNKKKVVDHE